MVNFDPTPKIFIIASKLTKAVIQVLMDQKSMKIGPVLVQHILCEHPWLKPLQAGLL